MLSFKIISLLFLTTIHFYLFCKLYAAFGKRKWLVVIGIFFILILVAWFLRRSFPNEIFQTWLVPVLFTWIGFVLIALPWLLLSDILHLVSWLLDKITKKHWARFTASRITVPLVLVFSLCLSAYGYWSANHPLVKFIELTTTKLPEDVVRVRIVQLSDIHIGPWVESVFLERILGKVAKLKPDLIVITGDLIDGDMESLDLEARILARTRSRYGKFAVTGNHELIVGLNQSLEFMKRANLRVLRGEKIEVAGIELIGIDDPLVMSRAGKGRTQTLSEILHGEKSDKFRLVLAHRPDVDPEMIGLFDLQLSGHTHNGQIWPGNLLVQHAFKYPAPGFSRYKGENGESTLYLNPGTGFWGPPMRLWTRPEITVIDLVPLENKPA